MSFGSEHRATSTMAFVQDHLRTCSFKSVKKNLISADRSWAITVMMDLTRHKHKRMITDPKVNDIWIFNFLWGVGDTQINQCLRDGSDACWFSD